MSTDVEAGGTVETEPKHFVQLQIEQDLQQGRYDEVVTRFPPEPNGYPHIGHAKAICVDFGMASQYGGHCNLRFDDTNPVTEDPEFVQAIQDDIRWLGFDWGEHLYFASDYYERFYDYAMQLVDKGLAYVDFQTLEQIREHRGSVTEAGTPSPWRDTPPEVNRAELERMKAGDYADGHCVLRAKIDMSSPNMQLRDPLLYRIRHAHHYRRGDAWCIYPMYDFAHCLGDYIEGVTHSLCSLEFENNRAIYDWVLDNLVEHPRPYQYEFARLNITYTVLSKRFLLQLVEEGLVDGWDDPRMPTLRGLRRRGVRPEAIRAFIDRVGVAKTNSLVDITLLDNAIRADLDPVVPRALVVLDPLPVELVNVPEGEVRQLSAPWHPNREQSETRTMPFTRHILIEREDFAQDPPRGWRRLSPGAEVRLRHGTIIRCDEVLTDAEGKVSGLRCTADPDGWSGSPGASRRVPGTLHWVSATHGKPAEVRLYERLFTEEQPGTGGRTYAQDLNRGSCRVLTGAVVEPALTEAPVEGRYQFERQGFFVRDRVDGVDQLVFNRIVALRDSWSRQQAQVDPEEAETEKVEAASEEGDKRQRHRRSGADIRAEARAADDVLTESYGRYTATFGIDETIADKLTGRREVRDLYEAGLAAGADPQDLANWTVNELLGQVEPEAVGALPFDGAAFGRLVDLVSQDTITGSIAKQVLEIMLSEGGDPAAIVEARGLKPVDDAEALGAMVDQIIGQSPEQVAKYKGGNARMLGYFVGQVMKRTQGKADARLVNELLRQRLGE